MPEQRDDSSAGDWARRASTLAARRGGYMAGLLAAYQEMRSMDERQLAAELGCPLERLPYLGLCREPRREQGQFAADVREIAGYADANVGRLAQLIRAVDTSRVLSNRRGSGRDGYLAAARDAEEAPEDRPGGAIERREEEETKEMGPDADLA